jgi:hypothetical protein
VKLREFLKKLRSLRVGAGGGSVGGRIEAAEEERLTIVPSQQDERPRH